MRKLKLQTQISLDGFCAGPNGEMDWMTWDWDDELKNFTTGLTDPVDTILLGRKMAVGFIAHWDEHNKTDQADATTRKFSEARRIIFSHSLTESPYPGVEVRNDLVVGMNELKSEQGGDIIAYGGAGFVTSLIENRLIDDCYLFVNPVAIGEGMPIFKNPSGRMDFELVKAHSFACGIVVMHYRHK